MNQIDKYVFFGQSYNNLGVSVHLGPWVYFRPQEGAKAPWLTQKQLLMQNRKNKTRDKGLVDHRMS